MNIISPVLTARLKYFSCSESVDYQKLAVYGNFKSSGSATAAWNRIKKKVTAVYDIEETDNNNISPAPGPATNAGDGQAGSDDDEDDEDVEDETKTKGEATTKARGGGGKKAGGRGGIAAAAFAP
ncbi:MAG: hypothetical protein Q9157_005431, partial [Trypethelium eluteriae]